MHPGHLSPNPWDARTPTDLQRLLFAACLDAEDAAEDAWREWLAKCNFDFEDPASIELAALAVSRLGAAAGDSSEASRCRGWNRRAWFLSAAALQVAQTLHEAAERRGLRVVGVGDLATHIAGHRFAGRPFPVRRVEFEVPGARREDLEELRSVTLPDSVADVVRSARFPLLISRAPSRFGPGTRCMAGSPEIPDAGTHIAWLAARNWAHRPAGLMRWILEILAVVQDAGDPQALAPAVVAAARREGTFVEVIAALRLVGSVPGGEKVAGIVAALESAPWQSLWRARRRVSQRVMRR